MSDRCCYLCGTPIFECMGFVRSDEFLLMLQGRLDRMAGEMCGACDVRLHVVNTGGSTVHTQSLRLSDSYGFLQLSRDYGLPYGTVLLMADRADMLWSGNPTTLWHQQAWKEVNRAIPGSERFEQFMRAIDYHRHRFKMIKEGRINAFETSYRPTEIHFGSHAARAHP